MTDYNEIGPKQEIAASGLVYDRDSLFAILLQVEDRRHAKGKIYPLANLLALILLAKLAGEDTPSGIAEWGANRVDELVEMKVLAKAKAPCHMTIRRVFQSMVSAEDLESLISQYHQRQLKQEEDGICYSMDGKTLRGTIPYGETRGTHLLSLYAPQQNLVLVEAAVDRKENEIVVAPHLLEQVDLKGTLVIGDAMHTQRETSSHIRKAEAHYLWTVKGNQARTEWAIEKLFVHEACQRQAGAPLSKEIRIASQVKKGHGRREKRTLWASSQLNDYLDWPDLQQVFRLERLIWHEKQHGHSREVIYGMTSLPHPQATPRKLLRLVRGYWAIENGLHYRRDVTLHEDRTRLTVGQAGHVLAILNNVVIGLCLHKGQKNLAKSRRFFNAKPLLALMLIIASH